MVGASGTGIQEVSTIIHKLGAGVTNAIGTGGRDLKAEVQGTTFKDAVALLDQDPAVKVIVAISKPPAKEVRDDVVSLLRAASKPVVAIFLGEKPEASEKGLYRAYTLEETARMAVDLLNGEAPKAISDQLAVPAVRLKPTQKYIKGYYSGGTLAYEAATLINDALGLNAKDAGNGFILKKDGYEVIDLGDDIYTQGRPHPMIDATKRKEMMLEAGNDPETAAILIDIVLGYGAHENMAGELAPTIKKVMADAKAQGRSLPVIATIVGTDLDPQDYQLQQTILEEAGVILCQSNAQAVKTALTLVGKPVQEPTKPILPKQATTAVMPAVSEELQKLLSVDRFINVGLESFAKAINENGGQAIQFDWHPIAGGNVELQKALIFLDKVSLNKEVEV
jgi:FdrA protein